MSAKSITEADGKAILNYHLTRAPVIKPTPLPPTSTHNPPPKLATIYFPEDANVKGVLDAAETTYPWLLQDGAKLVAKPDQLIKRRGKSGLLALNKTWAQAREWIEARAGKEQQVETVKGALRNFLVEPFVPHPEGTEYYININSVRDVGSKFRLILRKISLLTYHSRATGYFSHMRVVSMSGTSMPRLKRSSSPLIFRNTHLMKNWRQRCSRMFLRVFTESSSTSSLAFTLYTWIPNSRTLRSTHLSLYPMRTALLLMYTSWI